MPITQSQLADQIEQAFDSHSNLPDIDPEVARREIAEDLAAAFAAYVDGREATGLGYQGTPITVTIQGS